MAKTFEVVEEEEKAKQAQTFQCQVCKSFPTDVVVVVDVLINSVGIQLTVPCLIVACLVARSL